MVVKYSALYVVLASRSGYVSRDGQGLAIQLELLGGRACVAAIDSSVQVDLGMLMRVGGYISTTVLYAAGMAYPNMLKDLEGAQLQ